MGQVRVFGLRSLKSRADSEIWRLSSLMSSILWAKNKKSADLDLFFEPPKRRMENLYERWTAGKMGALFSKS